MSDQDLNRRDWLKVGVGALAAAAMPALWPLTAQAHKEDTAPTHRLTAQVAGEGGPPPAPPVNQDVNPGSVALKAPGPPALPQPKKEL